MPKIKQDGKLRRARHLIIETRTLRRGGRGHCERDGVLVCQPDYAEALTYVLRKWMIAAYREDGPEPDEDALWEYLDGENFRERRNALRKVAKDEGFPRPRGTSAQPLVGGAQRQGWRHTQRRRRNRG